MDDKNTLESAVRILVLGKYQLDYELANFSNNASLLDKFLRYCKGLSNPNKCWTLPRKLYTPSISPLEFVKFALPFSKVSHSLNGCIEEIDPFLVLGGTFKVYKESNEGVFEKIERLNGLPDKSSLDEERINHVACYCKIGSLPLYIACEGKNRVLMYQSVKRPVRAIVTQTGFPEPEELILHPILPFNLYAISCSNSRFYENIPQGMIILPFHELILPLLNCYGVKVGNPIFSIRALYDWRSLRKTVASTFLGEDV